MKSSASGRVERIISNRWASDQFAEAEDLRNSGGDAAEPAGREACATGEKWNSRSVSSIANYWGRGVPF